MQTPTRHPLAAVRSRVLAIPSWVLVIELFIGAGWLRAAAEKLLSGEWWTGDALARFLTETDGDRVPWFGVVTDIAVAPNLMIVSTAVVVLQVGVGLALVAGRHRVPALLVAMTMNVAFVLAGAVTPSAFYLLAQLAVLLWVIESGTVDRWRALAASVSVAALALVGSAVLSIRTLHPDRVIEDPSMMMVFLGGLAVLGAQRAEMVRAAADGPRRGTEAAPVR